MGTPARKHVRVNSIDLSYDEINPDAPETLFFIHGNSASSLSWKNQLKSRLLTRYRLIAIDLPAHGDSGVSPTPAVDYSLPGLANMIAQAVKLLTGASPFVLLGTSLGTNILAEALLHDLSPKGVILLGPCLVNAAYPVEKLALPGTEVAVVFEDEASETRVLTYASEILHNSSPEDKSEFLENYYSVKAPFRRMLGASLFSCNYHDQLAAVINTQLPVLIVFGQHDKVVNPDYLDDAPFKLWKEKVFKIPEAGHLVQVDQAEHVNKLIQAYCEDAFEEN